MPMPDPMTDPILTPRPTRSGRSAPYPHNLALRSCAPRSWSSPTVSSSSSSAWIFPELTPIYARRQASGGAPPGKSGGPAVGSWARSPWVGEDRRAVSEPAGGFPGGSWAPSSGTHRSQRPPLKVLHLFSWYSIDIGSWCHYLGLTGIANLTAGSGGTMHYADPFAALHLLAWLAGILVMGAILGGEGE